MLALLEERARHGYEIGKLIETRSGGVLKFHIASLYPMLYNLEAKGLLGSNVKPGPNGKDRRYYRLTAAGRKRLAEDREQWSAVVRGMTSLGISCQRGADFVPAWETR